MANIMDIFEQKNSTKDDLNSVYDYNIINSEGLEVPLSNLRAKVLMLINVSVQDQDALQIFKKLYTLYAAYKNKGLRRFLNFIYLKYVLFFSSGLQILLFPCGQFGSNETYENVTKFMKQNNFNFGEVLAPIHVNGTRTTPLFKYMKKTLLAPHGEFLKSNFTIFVANSKGHLVLRLAPPYLIEDLKDVVDSCVRETEKFVPLHPSAVNASDYLNKHH